MYRLIFVDDEDMIRDFFEEIIDFPSYGFELTASFSSAEEALRYLSGHPEIDVVITDIKMGQMSGLDLCEEAQKLCPQLVFVLLVFQIPESGKGAEKLPVLPFDFKLGANLYRNITAIAFIYEVFERNDEAAIKVVKTGCSGCIKIQNIQDI